MPLFLQKLILLLFLDMGLFDPIIWLGLPQPQPIAGVHRWWSQKHHMEQLFNLN